MQAVAMRATVETLGPVIRVRRDRIRRCKDQPRTYFDKARLQELADSIAMVGQKVPVLLRPVDDDPKHDYELVDGERRWLACKMVNIEHMKAWVTDKTDPEELFEDSVVSNFGREGHTVLETARAMGRMRQKRSVVDIAKIFVCSQPYVYQHLSFLKFPPQVQRLMEPDIPEERRINFSIGILLASVPNEDLQIELALTISERGMRVSQAKHLIKTRSDEMGFTVGRPGRSPKDDYRIFARFWERTLGELELFYSYPVERFRKFFEYRGKQDLANLMARIARSQMLASEIMKRLKRL